MQIETMTTRGRPERKTRKPAFPVSGTMKPYGLYPVMAHPVLPGETLQSASIKVRNISMPVVNPVGGAWLETWLVYFKLTDLDPDLTEMFISDSMATTGFTRTTDNERYFAKGGDINWVQLCTSTFYSSYFRHETEPVEGSRWIDAVPQVKINNKSWYQNMSFQDSDVTVPITDASDMYKHLQDYQVLQQMGLVEMTYEKYLEEFGVQNYREKNDPEILRFTRSWTMPTNIVEPTTGSPTSAWVWGDQTALDKPKKFKEPGFVVMFQCVRPKLYQANITKSSIGDLWGFSDWFPIYTANDPTAGIKEISTDANNFIAASRTDPAEKTMIYDHRDLLMHGEQFVNNWADPPYRLPTSTGLLMNDASTPEDLRGEYCLEADINGLFVGTDPYIYYDGLCLFNITGHVQDHTSL